MGGAVLGGGGAAGGGGGGVGADAADGGGGTFEGGRAAVGLELGGEVGLVVRLGEEVQALPVGAFHPPAVSERSDFLLVRWGG